MSNPLRMLRRELSAATTQARDNLLADAQTGKSSLRRVLGSLGGRRLSSILSLPIWGRIIRWAGRGYVRCKGVTVDVRSSLVTDRNVARIFFGIYEGAELRMIRAWTPPAEQILDLGASLGVAGRTAISASSRHGYRQTYVGVEANPLLANRLEQTVGVDLDVDVTVVNAAISYAEADVYFRQAPTSEGGTIHLSGPGELVPAIKLRDLVQHHLNPERSFDLLCDIEGAEFAIFEQDSSTLASCRQMVVEIHPREHETREQAIERAVFQANRLGFEMVDQQGKVVALTRREGDVLEKVVAAGRISRPVPGDIDSEL